jgi:hypothetical protein
MSAAETVTTTVPFPAKVVPWSTSPKWATALAAAQAEMPPIEKKRSVTVRTDKGSYSYSYADLADIFAAVRPVLAKHELAVTQDVQIQDGKVLCYTMIWHSSGESHSFGPVTLNAGSTPQNAGSAITYARRYGLSAALGIATEEDDDAQHAEKKPRKPVPSSGPQSDTPPNTHTGRTTDSDSQAPEVAAASGARTDGIEPSEEVGGGGSAAGPSDPQTIKAFIEALERRFPGKSRAMKVNYVNALTKDEKKKINDISEKQLGTFNKSELLAWISDINDYLAHSPRPR